MSLDYKIDRLVRYVSGEEARSPGAEFDWALQEDIGKGDWRTTLYPYRWTSHFAINGLSLVTDYGVPSSLILENEVGEYGVNRYVSGNLIPKPNVRGVGPWYSFLGSDRYLSELGLRIHPWDKENPQAWLEGSVGYETEHEFTQIIVPDYLNIEIYLPSVEFDTIASKIENGLVAEASLYVSRVSGFYAQWSPVISTQEIKVIWSGLEIINGESLEAEQQILTLGDGISGFEIRCRSPSVGNTIQEEGEGVPSEFAFEETSKLEDELDSLRERLDECEKSADAEIAWALARWNHEKFKKFWFSGWSLVTGVVIGIGCVKFLGL